ncbi:hypothetical protein [Kroppenstedtia guangzhouensis]|uniref:hypothetical protein n=1 Tax=Kroppenstedtia guangzhouensis TaxID=1274356 RepID=UPI001667016F|nr:hypothetical protein [Kroppenstedtia guangzhouensis]
MKSPLRQDLSQGVMCFGSCLAASKRYFTAYLVSNSIGAFFLIQLCYFSLIRSRYLHHLKKAML